MTTQQTPRQIIEQLSAFVDQQEVARASAQALALQHEQTINAIMDVLTKAGIANDAPLPAIVARLVGERNEGERTHLALIAEYAKQSAQVSELQSKVVATYAKWYAPHKIKMDAQRAELDQLRAEHRALCDLLSADSTTIAGQTLAEGLRAILAERDALRATIAQLEASHE